MNNHNTNTIRFAAVGDLLFTVKPGGNPERGLEVLSQEIIELFETCDIVFANLESTLSGAETISTEPRIVSSEKQILSLENAGINAVTLGNNHAFDCFEEGFYKVSGFLDKMKIPWCGAGLNIKEASRPLFMQFNGIKGLLYKKLCSDKLQSKTLLISYIYRPPRQSNRSQKFL